jgi:hypothetical protein
LEGQEVFWWVRTAGSQAQILALDIQRVIGLANPQKSCNICRHPSFRLNPHEPQIWQMLRDLSMQLGHATEQAIVTIKWMP